MEVPRVHARTIERPGGRSSIASLAAASLIVLAGLGWSTATSRVAAADVPAIFDSSLVHAIGVTYDQADYDAMIAAYEDTGEKEWLEATVTIDGVAYEQAGIRLKGNSSLMGLGGGRFGGGGFPGRGLQAPAASAAPGASAGAEPSLAPETAAPPDASGAPDVTIRRPGGFGGSTTASADTPEKLPWLIRLDKYVDGQAHQGYTDLVVRSNNSATSLNEAVALELLEQAGLASQHASSTSFSVNGGDRVLRLIIENPGDTWQDASFDGSGALYKAESTGDWSYRGDDPESYADIFDQEAGKDVADLTPLIEFLRFINESDEATFAAELPARFDVDAFATYLAMMDLVDNFDDIDGPGNNAYLHWDAATGMLTIVPWDMNLAFGGLGGGRGGPGGFQLPEGFDPGQLPEGFDPGQLPEGFDPGQLPEGFDPGQLPEGFDPGQRGRGGIGRSNPLTEKFHANPEFEALYQAKLVSLRADLIDSGVAQAILGTWTDMLTAKATDLVDVATITEEAAGIAAAFNAP
jgi:spore coat protein CotH